MFENQLAVNEDKSVTEAYKEDLAYVHDVGFTTFIKDMTAAVCRPSMAVL